MSVALNNWFFAIPKCSRSGYNFGFYFCSANNVAASEKRKTITPEDILSAMRDMEMDQFVNPLRKCLDGKIHFILGSKLCRFRKKPT